MNVSRHVLASGTTFLASGATFLAQDGPYLSSNASAHTVNGGIAALATNSSAEDSDLASPSLESTRFVVQTIVTPIVVTVGLLGNVLNMLVLVQPTMRTSTNVYLLVLSLADSVYLIFSFALSFVGCRRQGLTHAAYAFNTYGRTISDLAGNIAVWIIVIFTVERYVAVCHPMQGKVWCTVKRAKLFSLGAVLFCFTNTFPGFLELEVVVEDEGPKCRYTAFAQTKAYELGYSWWYVTIFSFVPIVFLLIYNSLLIRALLRASRERDSLVSGRHQRDARTHVASGQRGGGRGGEGGRGCAVVAGWWSCCCVVENRKALDAARRTHELPVDKNSRTCFLMCETFGWYSAKQRPHADVYDKSFYDTAENQSCDEGLEGKTATFVHRNGTIGGRPAGRASRKSGSPFRHTLKCFGKAEAAGENGVSEAVSSAQLSARLHRSLGADPPTPSQNGPRREPARSMLSNRSCSPASSINYSSSNPSPAGRESSGFGRRSREQQKVTLMLVIIVIIFLVCQLPWTILFLYRTYVSAHHTGAAGRDAIKIAGNVVNLLVQINASGNFYLYSFFSKRFRRTFTRLVPFCRTELTVSSV